MRGEVRRVIDRFLAGVLLEDTGSTSNAFALLLARTFALGVPALPAAGMQALPLLLAGDLTDRIVLNRRATGISPDAAGGGCPTVIRTCERGMWWSPRTRRRPRR